MLIQVPASLALDLNRDVLFTGRCPVFPVYGCAVCSMPAEYCEFSPDFEKCKPWLIKNVPDLYPQLVKGEFCCLVKFLWWQFILDAVKVKEFIYLNFELDR